MYARNFLEVDNNILYARVDMAGELSGITAKEFPLYNYLIYLVSLVFGWQDWYGRLINLVISSFGSYYFYLAIKKFFGEKYAFAATIILMASIWFSYSRKIMPDTFSMSLAIAGLYFGITYLYSGGYTRLLLYMTLGTLGVLSKIPSVFIFVVLLIPFFNRNLLAGRKAWFFTASAILLGINAIWYLYWVPEVVGTYGFVHYPERGFLEGARQIIGDPGGALYRFYWNGLNTYAALVAFVGGLIMAIIRKQKEILVLFLLLFAVFFIFILKAGSSFIQHNYYMIPFAPVMAFVAGYFLSGLKWKWVYTLLLIAISAEGIANQQHEFFIPKKELYKMELESIADSVSNRNDLVAISGGHNPQQLYFAHRKGWALNDEEIDEKSEVQEYMNRGAKYLFINKNSGIQNFDACSVVYEDEHYIVYALTEKP